MKRIMMSVFTAGALTLSFLPNVFANEQELHAQGEILGENISIEVEKDGVAATYTVGPEVREFYLRPSGSLSAGATTRCDPVLGKLKAPLTLRVNIKERYTQGDYDPATMSSPRTQVGPTGEESLTYPAGSTLVGRCGSDSNVLVAMSLHKPR